MFRSKLVWSCRGWISWTADMFLGVINFSIQLNETRLNFPSVCIYKDDLRYVLRYAWNTASKLKYSPLETPQFIFAFNNKSSTVDSCRFFFFSVSSIKLIGLFNSYLSSSLCKWTVSSSALPCNRLYIACGHIGSYLAPILWPQWQVWVSGTLHQCLIPGNSQTVWMTWLPPKKKTLHCIKLLQSSTRIREDRK